MTTPPFKVAALFPFTSDVEDDLHFGANQEIQVDAIEDEDWYSGHYTSADGTLHSGMFPKNFVKIVEEEPLPAIPIPPRPSLSKSNESTGVAHQEMTEEVSEPHHLTNAEPVRGKGLSARISTFNQETSTPINPDAKPKEESFVKKPFFAHESSYIPPSYSKPAVKKEEPKNIPPPVNSSTAAPESNSPTEEEGPKLSLKERIALLQKRQQEEAEREAELEKRRQEKKELKKKKKAESHVDQTQPPIPVATNTTGGSLLSASSHASHATGASAAQHYSTDLRDEGLMESSEDELEPEGNHYQDESNDFVDARSGDEESLQEVSHSVVPEPKEDEQAEAEDDDDDDEEDGNDEDDEDDEEARKRALRERMAKLSGGVGMFGMMGMPSPFAAPAAKPKKAKKEGKPAEPIESIPTSESSDVLPSVPTRAPEEELPPTISTHAPQIPMPPAPLMPIAVPQLDDEDEYNDEEEEEDSHPEQELQPQTPIVNDSSDDEEDTFESPAAPPIPAFPQHSFPQSVPTPRAEIVDHETDRDDFDDNETADKSALPGAPLVFPIDVNTTGYDADDDTDPTAAAPPLPGNRPNQNPFTGSTAPPIPPVPSMPPVPPIPSTPITSAPLPPIPGTAPAVPSMASPPRAPPATLASAPPIPSIASPPPVPHSGPIQPPPVPINAGAPPIPGSTPAIPPPIPGVPPPVTKSLTFHEGTTATEAEIAPVRRASTHKNKGAPPLPPITPISPRKSTDSTRKSVEVKRNSSVRGTHKVDLPTNTDWWVRAEIPPTLAPEIGKNAVFEVDTHEIVKRAGRKMIYRDYYILYHDLSQLVIEASFSVTDPIESVSFHQYEVKAPRANKDKLDKLSTEYGSQVLSLAESLGGAHIGANRLVPYIFDKLLKRFKILPSIGSKGHGAVVFKYSSPEDYVKYDEIRPGDILCLKAEFVYHNKLRQKVTVEVGANEVHACVIYEFDPTKQKFRVIETDHSGKLIKNSYRLSELKSGKLRVFRVVGRDYINWN